MFRAQTAVPLRRHAGAVHVDVHGRGDGHFQQSGRDRQEPLPRDTSPGETGVLPCGLPGCARDPWRTPLHASVSFSFRVPPFAWRGATASSRSAAPFCLSPHRPRPLLRRFCSATLSTRRSLSAGSGPSSAPCSTKRRETKSRRAAAPRSSASPSASSPRARRSLAARPRRSAHSFPDPRRSRPQVLGSGMGMVNKLREALGPDAYLPTQALVGNQVRGPPPRRRRLAAGGAGRAARASRAARRAAWQLATRLPSCP